MATFWEIAAYSVDHMFSLYFDFFVILVISCFGFEGWSWVLIASVPDLCIFFTFKERCDSKSGDNSDKKHVKRFS